MSLVTAKRKFGLKPLVRLPFLHLAGSLELLKRPVRQNSLVPKISVGQRSQRQKGLGVNSHIGVAFRVAVADIEVLALLCLVTVYDSSYNTEEPPIQIRLSTTFVVDAAVSPDCQTVAVVTMGQEGGAFQSQVRFYPVDSQEPSAVISLGNTVVLDLDYEEGLLWVLGEDQVSAIQEDGTASGVYTLGRNYLKGCSFGGDGYALLLLGRYQAGSAEQAVIVGPDGTELASLDLTANVLDFDAAGRYVSLLTGDQLDIYTSDFTPYSSLDQTQNARYISLTDSGAALLANSQQAWLYLPS